MVQTKSKHKQDLNEVFTHYLRMISYNGGLLNVHFKISSVQIKIVITGASMKIRRN